MIRKMRFEEFYEGWTESHLAQEEAGRLLGVCARTFRRFVEFPWMRLLTHKAHIINCNWDSYRLKQSLKEKRKQGRTTHANNGL